ncbi:MAG: hypothetical protein RI932_1865 [Pseudomonadota bacterium]|jgi:hypothetical protein
MKYFTVLGLSLLLASQEGWAEWDLSRLRALGAECLLGTTEVDDSKLTVKFSRFAAMLEPFVNEHSMNVARCSIAVGFKVPPRHRLATLTHRVFAHVNKNSDSQVSLQVSMVLNNQTFSFSGTLPEDSVLDQKVLLYKSFVPGDSFMNCSNSASDVNVTLNWQLLADATTLGGNARLTLAGDDLWTDTWIETRPCEESAHAFALADTQIR